MFARLEDRRHGRSGDTSNFVVDLAGVSISERVTLLSLKMKKMF